MTIERIRQAVNETREALRDELSIEEVYLFGSYVNGQPNEDSDVDLCFVVGDEAPRELDTTRKIRLSLYQKLRMPLDIFVYKETPFRQKESHPSALAHQIAETGVRL